MPQRLRIEPGEQSRVTYGNNLTLSMSYNARLKSTQFEVAGRPAQYGSSSVMKTQYQYYDDGALKYADDLLDNRFDRAYGYDQLTRLKEDYSGSEASDFANQTSSGTTTGPYRQSYSYDAWSNFTSRTGRFWSKPTTFTASYSNGRNTDSLWQYDADGRVLRENSLKYTFDAAGRNVTASSTIVNQIVGGIVTQTRDGDGLEIKREETRQGLTTTAYRLRSSLLGGKVVTELNATGQKQKSYVYLGGERLAEQEGGSVTWKHTNPLTGSEGSSYASGLYIPEKEPDPTMVDVGFLDPYLNFEESKPDSLQLLGGNSNGKCTVEGMSWDCTSAYRMRELGIAGEMISTTVYAIYGDGHTKAIWTGLASLDPLGKAVSSSPVGSPGTGSTGSNGHAPDTSTAVLAGTDDSSVTVVAGADYVSTGPHEFRGSLVPQKSDCAKYVDVLIRHANLNQKSGKVNVGRGFLSMIPRKQTEREELYPTLGISGFQNRLIDHQGGWVYAHITGIAGGTLIGNSPILLWGQTGTELVNQQMADDHRELNTALDMKQLGFALYDYYGTLRPLSDVLAERKAEVADDVAGQKVGEILGAAIDGKKNFQSARSQIFNLLCDY